MFHVCEENSYFKSFLCPNGTIFNQKYLVCDWWYKVNCSQSSKYFQSNNDIGIEGGNLLLSTNGFTENSDLVGFSKNEDGSRSSFITSNFEETTNGKKEQQQTDKVSDNLGEKAGTEKEEIKNSLKYQVSDTRVSGAKESFQAFTMNLGFGNGFLLLVLVAVD